MWSKPLAHRRLLVALLALPLFHFPGHSAEEAPPFGVFPRSNEVFHILLADPREIQLSGAYYQMNQDHVADASLGHSWGMARWHSKQDTWVYQWDIEGMAYSRFKLSGGVNEFETVDFIANLPIEARHDWISARLMIFHQSSHLGDDFIRRTGNQGVRYSVEGLKGQLSEEPLPWLRIYQGTNYLLHTVPSHDRWTLQTGIELTSPDLKISVNCPTRLYLASDLQSHENVRWNLNSNTELGLKIGFKNESRIMRIHIGYFTGHSPFGQFFTVREHYANLGLSFDF